MHAQNVLSGQHVIREVLSFMTEPPYALWSIWSNLSHLQQAFLLMLGVVSSYSLFSAAKTLLRLRLIRRLRSEESAHVRESASALSIHCANVRRVIGATFYLFGLVLFLGLQTVGHTLGGGFMQQILGNFLLHFAFAANVFFVFLTIHSIQWLVSARVDAFAVEAQQIE